MSLSLDLENSANWEQRLTQILANSDHSLARYIPSFEFTSNIIAVFADSSESLDTWYSAGWIGQRINLPFGITAESNINEKRLQLKQKQLLIFPGLVSAYKIYIRFPRWFTQASITVWEYTGPQIDTVEQKLDTLLQQYPP